MCMWSRTDGEGAIGSNCHATTTTTRHNNDAQTCAPSVPYVRSGRRTFARGWSTRPRSARASPTADVFRVHCLSIKIRTFTTSTCCCCALCVCVCSSQQRGNSVRKSQICVSTASMRPRVNARRRHVICLTTCGNIYVSAGGRRVRACTTTPRAR